MKTCKYKEIRNSVPYPRTRWIAECGFDYVLIEGYNKDFNSKGYYANKKAHLTGNCMKCGGKIIEITEDMTSEVGEYDTTNWQNSAQYRNIEPKCGQTADLFHSNVIDSDIEPKYREWTLAEFMGKYIRKKGHKIQFVIAEIDYDLQIIGNRKDVFRTPIWWLENGECLKPDMTVGVCGELVK